MKSIYLAIATVIVLGLTSCGGGSDNKHIHGDGCTHEGNSEATVKPTEQEAFKVEADSCDMQSEETHHHDHDHDHGYSHKH